MDSEFLSNEDYVKKVEQNKFPIIDKDYRELSETELQKFINEAKTRYFYYKKNGVNVAYGKELENRNGKFDIELFACKKLVEYGHEVYLLPENYAKDNEGNIKIHGDTITDNAILELKHTPSNIQGNYRKAKHQATDIFLHIKNDISKENALEQIKRAIRSMKQDSKSRIDFEGKVYLYFEMTNNLLCFVFDKNGNFKQTSPKKE